MLYFPDTPHGAVALFCPPRTASRAVHQSLRGLMSCAWISGLDPGGPCAKPSHHTVDVDVRWRVDIAAMLIRHPLSRLQSMWRLATANEWQRMSWDEYSLTVLDPPAHWYWTWHWTLSRYHDAINRDSLRVIRHEQLDDDLSQLLGQRVTIAKHHRSPLHSEPVNHNARLWAQQDATRYGYELE